MVTYEVTNCLKVTGLPSPIQDYFEQTSVYDTTPYSDPNNSIPPQIVLFKKEDDSIFIPRGREKELINICYNQKLDLQNITQESPPDSLNLEISESINYTSGPFGFQEFVIKEMLKHTTSRIKIPPGGGKTNIACITMALLDRGPILFLAHTDRLLTQFRNTVTKVLGIPDSDIGMIKGKKRVIKTITCGSLRTLGKSDYDLESLKNKFKIVFFDECHLSSALTCRNVLLTLAPERLYGLSATPEHYASKDLSNLMTSLLGDIVVSIEENQIPGRLIPETYTRETGRMFKYSVTSDSPEWLKKKLMHCLHDSIAKDETRNNLIVQDCIKLVNSGFKPIICTSRVAHAHNLYQKLLENGIKMSCPYTIKESKKGSIQTKVDHKALNEDVFKIDRGELSGLIGTYTLFDTGFDCPVLSALLMVGPFSGRNTTRIEQTVGRIQRFTTEKKFAIVLDYTDDSNPENILRGWSSGRVEFYLRKYGKHSIIE